MNRGSSPTFIQYSGGSMGNIGPTGATGITGPTGNTGSCLQGNTGYGITGIQIIGNDLGITFGSGNTLTLILNSSLKGTTGTTKSNNSFFNIRGTTTEGISIIASTNPTEYNSNSVTYGVGTTNKIVKLRGITFRNIGILSSSNGITLSSIIGINPYTIQGNTGELVYVNPSYSLIGMDNNSWDSLNKNITLTLVATKENDVSGLTLDNSNYRKDSVRNVGTESGLTMPLGGYTFNSLDVVPVSSINGTTFTEQAFYIKRSASKEIANQILFFNQQVAITSGNRVTFTPQNNIGITYGSCYLSKIEEPSRRCMDYTTQVGCNLMGGTFDEVSCAERDETYESKKSCCLYDYILGGITCINTYADECERFMGIVGNVRCFYFEGAFNKCPPEMCFACNIGKCCYKGSCYAENEFDCYQKYSGGVWFNEECDLV